MDPREAIIAAKDVVVGLDLSVEQEARAFEVLLRQFLDASRTPQVQEGATLPVPAMPADAGNKLAAGLGLSAEDVAAIFDLTDSGPELNVHSSHLPSKTAQTVREFAVLITCARDLIGLETTDKELRSALDRHGRYDPTNLTKQIATIDPSHLGYAKTSKKFTPRNPGREQAITIAKRYAGVE